MAKVEVGQDGFKTDDIALFNDEISANLGLSSTSSCSL